MRGIYTLSVHLYGLLIRLASPFHAKASLWIKGRKNWKTQLRSAVNPHDKWIWFHCASLGEFEQGRNLIEKIKQEQPDYKILLTFFSPSGYEIRKNYAQADHVCYLPLDTPANARQFLEIAQPAMAIFIKYEIWVNLILEMKHKKIPVYLVSALVRQNSGFFRSIFKGLYRKCFRSMEIVFTQNEESRQLIADFSGNPQVKVSGDTRFDRVMAVRDSFEEVPGVADFVGEHFSLVVGSSWPADERLLLQLFEKYQGKKLRWIIAPHEIHLEKIDAHIQKWPELMLRYSQIEQLNDKHQLLWIDNIGMLSRLYHYGQIAYIGGGFGSGIHNTLEAVVYGNPVIFGPNYQKFEEAVDLVEREAAVSISNWEELEKAFLQWYQNPEKLHSMRASNRNWAESKTGATQKVYDSLPF